MKRLEFGRKWPMHFQRLSGKRIQRASEPMSTLDAELNDFSAQLAMLGGHAADRDG
jgi:hypothetical protein